MPWEKSFEEADVVEQAMRVFWEKGFAATSISDITDATGIKRGSLYNAFDGKQELFLKSLLKYDSEHRAKLLLQLEAEHDPREAIEKFFDHCVRASTSDTDKKGCLLVNTSLEVSQHDEEVQAFVANAFKELAGFFENMIKRGHDQGTIPESVAARPTAKALIACLVGIRVMGRGTFGKTALLQVAEQAKRLIS